jgi:hypothetical protein
MRCTRFLGHKWSRWYKKVGGANKDASGQLVRGILQVRRCLCCRYIEEEWTNSVAFVREAPDKKE